MTNLQQIVKVGELDELIIIKAYSEFQNEFGEKESTFSDLATVYARVEYQNKDTAEEFQAQRETAITAVLFTVRYDSRFKDKKNLISYDDDTYDIISVKTLGRKRFLKIEANLRE